MRKAQINFIHRTQPEETELVTQFNNARYIIVVSYSTVTISRIEKRNEM